MKRLLQITLLVSALAAHAEDPLEFEVADIRVEGLQRISEGAVFNTLPVNIGDRIGAQRIREALRALNDTGFFRDVELRRDESTLVVVVQERPTIRTFDLKGNKAIKTEDMSKSLRNVGLASGKILNRYMLEDVRQYLVDQYFARGHYDVHVDVRVEDQPGNLVDVHVDIDEGKVARIRQINVVGNERFSDEELLAGMGLKAHNLLSFYRGDDRYSRQALSGDLEKLRSYYMDRGYADFEITSTQVALAPEKDDLFITVNVFEGTTWKTGAVKLAGRFLVPEEVLRQFVVVKPGDTYSQRLIAMSEQRLRERLNEAGFGYAEVAAVPSPNAETGEIALTFQIEPNARTYVRHINFNGVEHTNDEVLRREFRQLEGGVLSNASIARSQERLQRLPYIEKVETETRRVEGTADLVDIDVTVEEGRSSMVGGGIGYSERQSFMLQGSYIDSNLFGTGDRLAVELNGGKYTQVFSVAHTDQYFTEDGVARSFNASYVERDRLTSSFSQFTTQTYSAGFGLGYPISEDQFFNVGLVYSHENLATAFSSSTQLRDWVRNNGDYYFRRVGRDRILGTLLDTVEITGSWLYDSRNRSLFPTRGGSHRLSVSIAPPINDVSFVTRQLPLAAVLPYPGRGMARPLSVVGDHQSWLVRARSATPRQCRRIVMCSRAAAIRCEVFATARWGHVIRWAIPTAATRECRRSSKPSFHCPPSSRPRLASPCSMTSASRSIWAIPSSVIRAAIARTTASISASCAALPVSPCSGCRPWVCSACRTRCRCAGRTRRDVSTATTSKRSSSRSEPRFK